MTTYDENGGYPHPDHIRCHEISVAAFEAAPDADRFPDAGRAVAAAQAVLRRRLQPRSASRRCTPRCSSTGLESPFEEWRKRWDEMKGSAAAEDHHAGRRRRLVRAPGRRAARPRHPGRPNGWFFSVPLDIQREAWPTEDFELARSLVDSTIPEDDLFAGIRERVVTALLLLDAAAGKAADRRRGREVGADRASR